ncbi:hypothetical protein GCM10007079_22960 [Nocardiopsis terrae]|nr:hypothetical protein GCM10007079_22960 [Nocardiopsis terrae]
MSIAGAWSLIVWYLTAYSRISALILRSSGNTGSPTAQGMQPDLLRRAGRGGRPVPSGPDRPRGHAEATLRGGFPQARCDLCSSFPPPCGAVPKGAQRVKPVGTITACQSSTEPPSDSW